MAGFARTLRKRQTDAESRIWRHLRNRQLDGYKFRRQQLIAPFIVDFVCIEKRLVIELDGGQHTEQIARDMEQTRFLESKGYRVIRFWDNEVLLQTSSVLERILEALNVPSPQPSPPEGGEGAIC